MVLQSDILLIKIISWRKIIFRAAEPFRVALRIGVRRTEKEKGDMIMDTKQCPYCREEISADATKCRYCKSVLVDYPRPGRECCRDLPGRMIAGVSVYMARMMGVSTAIIRLGFVLLTLLTPPLGIVLYAAIWAFSPFNAGGQRPIERLMDELRAMIANWESKLASKPKDESSVIPVPAPVSAQEGN